MSEISQQIAKAERARAAADEDLLSRPGVVGIDTGFKVTGGELQRDVIAIRIMVEKKGPVPAGEEIPRAIGDVPTDVIEVQKAVADSDPARYRPPLGGTSCAPASESGQFATLGCFVRDAATRIPMLLTASHVLAPADTGLADIVQPAPGDGGVAPADVIAPATTRRSRSGGTAGGGGIVGADCAVAALGNGIEGTDEIVGLGRAVGWTSAVLGETVKKRGRTSEISYGEVTGVDATIIITYAQLPDTTFYHQITVDAVAPYTIMQTDGDSGSLYLNARNEAVGLGFASTTGHERAFLNPIGRVLEVLAVEMPLDVPLLAGCGFSTENYFSRAAASISASYDPGNNPVSNVVNEHVALHWRSGSAAAGVSWLGADFKAALPVMIVGIFGTNLTAAGKWRVRLSQTSLGGADQYDSGVVPANVAAGYGFAGLVLPASVTARYCRIDVEDGTLAAGANYVDVGVAWAGALFQPRLNFAYGRAEGWIDPSVVMESRGGQTYVDVREKYRITQITFDAVDEAELYDSIFEIDRRAGIGHNIVFVPEPNGQHMNRQMLLGRLAELAPASNAQLGIWAKGYAIRERK